MQAIYAMHQSGNDQLDKQERYLISLFDSVEELYLIMLSALIELRVIEEDLIEKSKLKHLATSEERNPNTKFIDNAILVKLANSETIESALEANRINNWKLNDDCLLLLLDDIKASDIYKTYMSTRETTFVQDQQFLDELFTEVIAPNAHLYDYIEDYRLTFVDDLPVVNTQIQKQIRFAKANGVIQAVQLYKDLDDRDFGLQLFRKTVLNSSELSKQFINKTPNWDPERIAELDTIILCMAICEFLKFPSIPTKVTINEYLEIAKEYSTPKSSIFINGILDNLVKEYQTTNQLNKTGRGLM